MAPVSKLDLAGVSFLDEFLYVVGSGSELGRTWSRRSRRLRLGFSCRALLVFHRLRKRCGLRRCKCQRFGRSGLPGLRISSRNRRNRKGHVSSSVRQALKGVACGYLMRDGLIARSVPVVIPAGGNRLWSFGPPVRCKFIGSLVPQSPILQTQSAGSGLRRRNAISRTTRRVGFQIRPGRDRPP